MYPQVSEKVVYGLVARISAYAITPYQLKASQLLLYVFPSQPHTGSTTAGQAISELINVSSTHVLGGSYHYKQRPRSIRSRMLPTVSNRFCNIA